MSGDNDILSVTTIRLCVDANLMNIPGFSSSLQQMCDSQGFCYEVSNMPMSNTVTWQVVSKSHDGCTMREEIDFVMVIILVQQFIAMVDSHVQKAREHVDCLRESATRCDDPTFSQFVLQLEESFPRKRLHVAICGLANYLTDGDMQARRRYRTEVKGRGAEATRMMGRKIVTRPEVDQAIMLAELETGCACLQVNTQQQISDLIQCYSKAVMDKPKKWHRLSYVFSFIEEGTTGVKPDKTGAGLLKAWRQQLRQIPGLGPDTAEAIAAKYPSIEALRQAYQDCPNPAEAWKLTENIVIRRGAGALETVRRVGKQISLALYVMVTSDNPSCVL